MASIQEYLDLIKNAIYGKDVRQAIHDGIQQCYYDGKAGSTDLEARQRLDSAEGSIRSLGSRMSTAEGDIDTLDARVDQIVAPSGGAPSAAEVADGRIVDGVTYNLIGDAIRAVNTNLKSDISEIGRNDFDGNRFADDDYYSFSNGVVTCLKEDGRAETAIPYKMHLKAGEKYVLSVDYQSQYMVYLLYDPITQYVLHYAGLPNLHQILVPEQSGDFILKIYKESGFPITVDNIFIGKYEDWLKRIKDGILPHFDSINGNAEAINRAIYKANLSPFKTVVVPSGNYTLEKSIVIKSGVTLKSDSETSYTLSNGVNAPMIVNGNRVKEVSQISDTNITIDGGSWDGNRSGQSKTGTDGIVVGFWLTGVSNLKLSNLRVTNTRTYGMLLNNVVNVLAENLRISVGDVNNADNGDGFHVIGPATNVALINSEIKSEDNAIAFNADDVDHGTFTTAGNIQGITVDNININNADGGQGILLLSSLHTIKDVYINNIIGTAAYLLQMNSWNVVEGYEGSYENIVVKNVSMNWKKSQWNCFVYLSSGGTFNNLLFENINVVNLATSTGVEALFGFYKTYANTPFINNLIINGATFQRANLASGDWSFILFENVFVSFCSVKSLNDRVFNGRCIPIKLTNTEIRELNVADVYITSACEKGWVNLVTNSILAKAKFANMFSGEVQVAGITIDNTSDVQAIDVSNCGQYFYGLENANYKTQLITGVNDVTFPNASNTDYFSKGQLVINQNDGNMYLCINSGITASAEWQPNTAYGLTQKVTYERQLYVCVSAGTSGSTFSPTDGDFTDGTCKWRHLYGGVATFQKIN